MFVYYRILFKEMAPTTRSQARKQSETGSELIPLRKPEDRRENPGSPDQVENDATMFPAFVTAPIPLKVGMGLSAAFSVKIPQLIFPD